jgi:hypothetical protein
LIACLDHNAIKLFSSMFIALAGLVLARVVDPVTAQQIVGIITGMGG